MYEKFEFKNLLLNYKLNLLMGSFLLLFTNIFVSILPRVTNIGVSIIEKKQPISIYFLNFDLSINSISEVILIIFILSLLGFFIRTLSRVVLFNVGRKIEKDVRCELFNHLSTLDDEFYSKNSVGSLMNHLNADITNIRLFSGFAVLNMLNIFFVFFSTIPFLFSVDKVLGGLAILPFFLVIFSAANLTQKMFQKSKEYQNTLGLLQETVQESLSAYAVTRLFFKQDFEEERFFKKNQENFDAALDLAKIRIWLFPIMRFVLGICLSLILVASGFFIIYGRIELGDFVEINARVLQMAWPSMSIGFVLSIYHRGQASLSRVNQLLRIQPIIVDGKKNIGQITEIDVENLTQKIFDNFSLQNISFSVKKGQVLGLVGKIASGKSSIIKILSKRSMAPLGQVFFNGSDINDISFESLYKNISIVNQDPFVFNGTIKENIILDNKNISNEEIFCILKEVDLFEEINSFKDGILTVIGERGISISGGQRQRIAIARSLLQKRPILILDDALSSVDPKTEKILVENILKHRKSRITIISTSRLSMLKDADEILILEKGKVLTRGKHDFLLKTNKLYFELFGQNEFLARS